MKATFTAIEAEKKSEPVIKADCDNGFMKLANELVDALCYTKLSDQEHRVLFSIMRKTFGYGKSWDWVALDQICEMTGIKKPHVSKTIKTLVDRNIIQKEGRQFKVNTVVSHWKEKVTYIGNGGYLNKKLTLLPKQVMSVTSIGNRMTQTGNPCYLGRQPQKKDNITKDNRTKDSPPRTLKRACSFPHDFSVTDSMIEWANSNQIFADLKIETEQFKDHHLAKGSMMKDWNAAWRTWMRNTKKFSAPQWKQKQAEKQEKDQRDLDEWIHSEDEENVGKGVQHEIF